MISTPSGCCVGHRTRDAYAIPRRTLIGLGSFVSVPFAWVPLADSVRNVVLLSICSAGQLIVYQLDLPGHVTVLTRTLVMTS